jgi:hypothetical protein
MFFTSGNWHKGEWLDDQPNGYGTAQIDGRIHTGSWRDGCHRSGDRKAWVISTKAKCDSSGRP